MTKPSITKRSVKGAALTYSELDTNFQNLADATTSLTAGTGGTAVVADLNGNITLVAGTNITLSGDNSAKTITINSSGGTGLTNPLTADLTLGSYKIIDASGEATIQSTQGLMVKSNAYANAELTIVPGDISNAVSRISTKEGDLTINTNDGGSVAAYITLDNAGAYIDLNSSVTGAYVSFGKGITKHNGITTSARNALTASEGMIIYNSTTDTFQGYANGSWVTLSANTSGPAFSAYATNTLQTITSGSQQKVLFQTEEFDTNSNYSSSRFTPTVAGYYQLNSSVRIDGSTGTGEIMIVIWKNGSEYKRGTNQQGTQVAADFWEMNVSSIVYANGSTDYFEVYVQQTSGASRSITAVASPAITYFNGCFLRPA